MRDRDFWPLLAEGRRLAAPHAGEWRGVADEVWDEDGKRVCRCPTPALAHLLAVMHNLFLPMANALLMERKKRVDRVVMERD